MLNSFQIFLQDFNLELLLEFGNIILFGGSTSGEIFFSDIGLDWVLQTGHLFPQFSFLKL